MNRRTTFLAALTAPAGHGHQGMHQRGRGGQSDRQLALVELLLKLGANPAPDALAAALEHGWSLRPFVALAKAAAKSLAKTAAASGRDQQSPLPLRCGGWTGLHALAGSARHQQQAPRALFVEAVEAAARLWPLDCPAGDGGGTAEQKLAGMSALMVAVHTPAASVVAVLIQQGNNVDRHALFSHAES